MFMYTYVYTYTKLQTHSIYTYIQHMQTCIHTDASCDLGLGIRRAEAAEAAEAKRHGAELRPPPGRGEPMAAVLKL